MDVIIIGGGAAGLFAALLSRNKKMNVTLLEKNEVFGKKLSVTGSGRCNYTNLNNGTPIGSFVETARFLELLDTIRDEMSRNGKNS